jgi:MFS family permease
LIGVADRFWAVIALIVVWALLVAAQMPIHSAYLNGLIPSQQRATILSFDSMIGSSGGVVIQPVLGRSADAWGYAGSYIFGACISTLALPFVLLSRREGVAADTATAAGTPDVPDAAGQS